MVFKSVMQTFVKSHSNVYEIDYVSFLIDFRSRCELLARKQILRDKGTKKSII